MVKSDFKSDVGSSDEMPRQTRPEGHKWKCTVEWMLWARRQLAQNKEKRKRPWNQRQLSKEVRCSATAIGDAMGRVGAADHELEEGSSALVPAINRVLGGKPPRVVLVDGVDDLRAEIEKKVPALSLGGRDATVRATIVDLLDDLSGEALLEVLDTVSKVRKRDR